MREISSIVILFVNSIDDAVLRSSPYQFSKWDRLNLCHLEEHEKCLELLIFLRKVCLSLTEVQHRHDQMFSPVSSLLPSQPHDVTVSPDGKFVYVGEIGPDRLTSFHVVNVVPSGESLASYAAASGLSLAVQSDDAELNASSGASSAKTGFSAAVAVLVMTVGVLIIVIGGLLVGRQRCGGLSLRQATKIGFDRVCAAASIRGSAVGGHRSGAGAYHPMGDNFALSSGRLYLVE